MTLYRELRILLAGLAALGVIVTAGVFGSSVEQFLAGILGGGVLAEMYLVGRERTP